LAADLRAMPVASDSTPSIRYRELPPQMAASLAFDELAFAAEPFEDETPTLEYRPPRGLDAQLTDWQREAIAAMDAEAADDGHDFGDESHVRAIVRHRDASEARAWTLHDTPSQQAVAAVYADAELEDDWFVAAGDDAFDIGDAIDGALSQHALEVDAQSAPTTETSVEPVPPRRRRLRLWVGLTVLAIAGQTIALLIS
jgi:hypothetical protein